jgi:hypothetical protein
VKTKQKAHGNPAPWVKKNTKYQALLVLCLLALFIFTGRAMADCRDGVMLYEIYGGGGNSGAPFSSDYVVLYNSSPNDISLTGWSLQYTTASGFFAASKSTALSGVIGSKKYYLVKEADGSTPATSLPAADAIGTINMSATSGKLALLNNSSVATGDLDPAIVDLVSYAGSSNTKSVYRKNDACLDSDSFAADFAAHVPDPRNSSYQEPIIIITPPPPPDEKETCTKINLNEIYPFGEDEYVEVVNNEDHSCDLSGWMIEDGANHKKEFLDSTLVESGRYSFLKGKLYLNDDTDAVHLLDKNDVERDEVTYVASSKEKDHSYSLDAGAWKWTNKQTPGEKNEIVADSPAPTPVPVPDPTPVPQSKTYSDDILISELYPYPNTGEDEFIELYNPSDEDIDLENWILHDASKTGKYVFPSGEKIQKNSYLVIHKSDFKFALNNSGGESVTLFDPNGKEVSVADYSGAKEGISYSFNGSDWHWTQFLTPGEDNKFENVPKGTLDMDKDIYINVWANFSLLGLSKSAKATWDFGDGHKSYLAKTRHKYIQTGKYSASVKYSEGSEDVVKNFTVEVKKIPHPDVHIVSIMANPKGSDAVGETITLKNNSNKKINLQGWSIATSSKKKMINHPINSKFVLKKKQTKTLTKEYSKFSLNNKKGKIELRYPDGKVAYKLKYDKGGASIAEDEKYQKVQGGWAWEGGIQPDRTATQGVVGAKTIINIQTDTNTENTPQDVPEIALGRHDFVQRKNMLAQANNISKIELLNNIPQVFGTATFREESGQYHFTAQSPEEKHYALTFLEKIFGLMNVGINNLINKIL